MNAPGLDARAHELICKVLQHHPKVQQAKLFGSRAKGSHKPSSDIDLALIGPLDLLEAETVRSDLDELPLPFHFDVLAWDTLPPGSLREHIERVGVFIYP
jgi:predicted nucleotidyltransferase